MSAPMLQTRTKNSEDTPRLSRKAAIDFRGWTRAEPHEIKAVLWSFAYFFCLLCSFYMLRPLREEMGIQGGVDNLKWAFSGTFVAMLLALPLYGWAAARFARARLLPVVYLFFVANLLIFYALMKNGVARSLCRSLFSCGLASSTCSLSRYSGASWPISTIANRLAACSDSSLPAAASARLPDRCWLPHSLRQAR